MEVNGILRLFQIQYQLFEMGSEVQTVNVTVEEGKTAYDILLSNLTAFMMYSIRVRASTGAGFGPFTPSANHSTLEAGMCMHVCVRACSSPTHSQAYLYCTVCVCVGTYIFVRMVECMCTSSPPQPPPHPSVSVSLLSTPRHCRSVGECLNSLEVKLSSTKWSTPRSAPAQLT